MVQAKTKDSIAKQKVENKINDAKTPEIKSCTINIQFTYFG
jgi:hypothetical protein